MTIRYTNQRVEILNFVTSNPNHPTVEEVYKEVKKKLPRISKATVYQNLRFLEKHHLIQKVDFTSQLRFEGNLSLHHHIMCDNCGTIMDFESQELTDYSLNLANQVEDITIRSVCTIFYGICEVCQKQKKMKT